MCSCSAAKGRPACHTAMAETLEANKNNDTAFSLWVFLGPVRLCIHRQVLRTVECEHAVHLKRQYDRT